VNFRNLTRFVAAFGFVTGASFASAQESLAVDTTSAWVGIVLGADTIGQVITAPASGANLTAFEFFAVCAPPFCPESGGVFEWDDINGVVIGTPLGSAMALLPPSSPPLPPPVPTFSQARVRFEFPTPIILQPSRKYLLFANSIQPRFALPSWFLTQQSYPFGIAKEISPSNGTVTGPWITVTAQSPGPDEWAVRVFFATSPVPTLSPIGVAALLGSMALFAFMALRARN
jgi:hypothetical protein